MSTNNIKQSAVRGAAWTGFGQVARYSIATVTTIALARLIPPADFGVFAIIMAVTQFAQLFADFGVGAAVIQQRETSERALSTCFWVNLAIGAGCGLLLIVAAPFATDFFTAPALGQLALGAAANVVLCSIMVVPQSLLAREFRFRENTLIQLVAGITGSVAAVTSALMGLGVWSLLIQPIVGSIVSAALIFRYCGWKPRALFAYDDVKGIMAFSYNLLGSNVISYIGRNIHNFILGKGLGPAALGHYNMAQTITYFPIGQISAVIVRVLFPALSRLQDDLPRFRAGYLSAVSAIALGTFPITTGIFAVADDFVAVVFGPEWLAMTPVVKLVTWVSMLQSVGTTAGTILLSTGNSRALFFNSSWSAAASAIGLLIGANWGLYGVSIAFTIVNVITYSVLIRAALRQVQLPFRDYCMTLARPLAAALGMTVVVCVTAMALSGIGALPRLGICSAIGVVVYSVLTYLLNRELVLSLWGHLNNR